MVQYIVKWHLRIHLLKCSFQNDISFTSETEWVRTGIDVRVLWKLCCTWTVLKEALGCVAMVTAWGCSGESAFVLSSLDTSAVVTTGVLDFWEKRWTLLPRNLAIKLLHNYAHFVITTTFLSPEQSHSFSHSSNLQTPDTSWSKLLLHDQSTAWCCHMASDEQSKLRNPNFF